MATVKIVIQKVPLRDGSFPVKLRVTAKQKAKFYPLGLKADVKQWNKDLGRFRKNKPDYKEFNRILDEVEYKADNIREQLEAKGSFSFEIFEKHFLQPKAEDNVQNAYKRKIKALQAIGKESTAKYYKDSMRAFCGFTGNIKFDDITYGTLFDFVNYKKQTGVSGNSISIYLRALRTLHYEYSNKIDKPLPTLYRRFGINKLKTETRKRSLTKDQLQALINYTPRSKAEKKAVATFLFSFYARGMNLTDIAKLKSIEGKKYIEYRRSKTKGLFKVEVTYDLLRYADILPIIDNISYKTINNYRHNVNTILQRIAKRIGLPKGITLYWARHTFANLAREKGISIEIISSLLGHSSLETTKIYLKQFDTGMLDKAAQVIFN